MCFCSKLVSASILVYVGKERFLSEIRFLRMPCSLVFRSGSVLCGSGGSGSASALRVVSEEPTPDIPPLGGAAHRWSHEACAAGVLGKHGRRSLRHCFQFAKGQLRDWSGGLKGVFSAPLSSEMQFYRVGSKVSPILLSGLKEPQRSVLSYRCNVCSFPFLLRVPDGRLQRGRHGRATSHAP